MIASIYAAALICVLAVYFVFKKKNSYNTSVPKVPGLPIVGNGIQLHLDPIGFFDRCNKKFGGFYRIKVYFADYVMISDRKAVMELIKQDESLFSFHGFLEELNFPQSFSDNNTPLSVDTIRRGIPYNALAVTPLLKQTATNLVLALKKQNGRALEYSEQMDCFSKFAACAFMSCFLKIQLKTPMFNIVLTFFEILKKAMILTYFVPAKLIDLVLKRKMFHLRQKIRSYITETIEEYQNDNTKRDSPFFRNAADKIDGKTGKRYSVEQVAGLLLSSLFASTQNTSNLIQNMLIDLVNHEEIRETIHKEVKKLIEDDDMEGINHHPLLHACLMETCRLYPTLFGLFRKCTKSTTLGGFLLKKGDVVAISTPNFMRDEEIFKEPEKFNPYRFMGNSPESTAHHHVINWGAGYHLCPGKQFAIYEVKLAIAFILTNFTVEVLEKNIHVNYASTSSFAERKTKMRFIPIQ